MRGRPIAIDVNGEPMSLRGLAVSRGMAVSTVYARYMRRVRNGEALDAAKLTRAPDERFRRRGRW